MHQTMRSFHTKLLLWYARHRRDLPWRRTRDPYKILVSEIMLQQTQVDRVIPKYREFLKRFPTFHALAAARPREVILAWSGLGYNRRALNLHKTAQDVVMRHRGKLPADREELLKLKGIGPYTVGAILAFAFKRDETALDTNIRRVIHRVFFGSEFPAWKKNDTELEAFAKHLIPSGRGYDWNHALMDFGALQCMARRPLCETCPMQKMCKAYPKILEDVKHGRPKSAYVEPGPASSPNIPNRIFRGRVVEALRVAPRHTLSFDILASLVKSDYTEDDEPWLANLLTGLEKEGFVYIKKAKKDTLVSLV